MGIPIFIHHEVECGNISGLENSDYAIVALKQAREKNSRVILFGNQKNKDWWNDWVDVADYLRDDWEEFQTNFVNLAINYKEEYAKAFFRRLFVFYHYAIEKNIDEFFMCDSDVLIYENLSLDDRFKDCNYAMCMKKNQNLSGGPCNNNMAMAYTLGLSYWKTKDMGEFLQFINDTYSRGRSILMKKYEYHQKYNLAGGVCEMTLAYLWHQEVKEKKKVFNVVKYEKGCSVYDFGMHTSMNYLEDEYLVDEVTGNKKVLFKEGKPYFIRAEDNIPVRMSSMHMAGELKRYMSDIFEYTHKQQNERDDMLQIQEVINKHFNIIIYGAGIYARKLYFWIKKMNKQPLFFAVSEGYLQDSNVIDGVEVIPLDKVPNNDYLFIIGVYNPQAQAEVTEKLMERGFHNILRMDLIMLGI